MSRQENIQLQLKREAEVGKRQARLLIGVEKYSTNHQVLDVLRAAIHAQFITKVSTLDEKMFELRQGLAYRYLSECRLTQLETLLAHYDQEKEDVEEPSSSPSTFAEVCYQLSTRENGERAIELLASVLDTAPFITSLGYAFKRSEEKRAAAYRVLRDTLHVDLNTVQEYVDEQKVLLERMEQNMSDNTSKVDHTQKFSLVLKELHYGSEKDVFWQEYERELLHTLYTPLYEYEQHLEKGHWSSYGLACVKNVVEVDEKVRRDLTGEYAMTNTAYECYTKRVKKLFEEYNTAWETKLRDAMLRVGPTAYCTWHEFFMCAGEKWDLQFAAVECAQRHLGPNDKPWGIMDTSWVTRAGVPHDVVMAWYHTDFHQTVQEVQEMHKQGDEAGAVEFAFTMPTTYKGKGPDAPREKDTDSEEMPEFASTMSATYKGKDLFITNTLDDFEFTEEEVLSYIYNGKGPDAPRSRDSGVHTYDEHIPKDECPDWMPKEKQGEQATEKPVYHHVTSVYHPELDQWCPITINTDTGATLAANDKSKQEEEDEMPELEDVTEYPSYWSEEEQDHLEKLRVRFQRELKTLHDMGFKAFVSDELCLTLLEKHAMRTEHDKCDDVLLATVKDILEETKTK